MEELFRNEIARGRVACIEMDRSDDRFERVGENDLARTARVARFAAAQEQVVVHTENLCGRRDGYGIHECGTECGELAFRSVGIFGVEKFGNHQLQNRVTEKLEAFV